MRGGPWEPDLPVWTVSVTLKLRPRAGQPQVSESLPQRPRSQAAGSGGPALFPQGPELALGGDFIQILTLTHTRARLQGPGRTQPERSQLGTRGPDLCSPRRPCSNGCADPGPHIPHSRQGLQSTLRCPASHFQGPSRTEPTAAPPQPQSPGAQGPEVL